MSTRSGKRIHASVDSPEVTDIIMQSERKTRSQKQKENVELNTRTKHNYVSYPADEQIVSVFSNNKNENKTKKNLRNTLKEHNVDESEYDNLESNNNKNVRNTCKGKNLIESDNDDCVGKIQNHEMLVTNANGKKKYKKKKKQKINYVQSPEMVDITNHVKIKKKNRTQTDKGLKSIDITDLKAKQITNHSDMSVDSFHSAAGSPVHIKLIENGNEIEHNIATSACCKPVDAMVTSKTTTDVIKKTRNSTTRNSTYDKIEITGKIETKNFDTTFDKTADLLTSLNETDESFKKRMRSSIVNSTIENIQSNCLSNLNRTFEKVADVPNTFNSKVSTRKKTKPSAKNSTFDKIETYETTDVNDDNIKFTFSNTFQGDNISNISIKNTRNSTFDKIEIKNVEKSPDVTTNCDTELIVVDLASEKKRKSNKKNSTFNKIEKNILDTTFDKTSDELTAYNITDESDEKRIRSSISICSTIDNLQINKLSNTDGKFKKILDIPTIFISTVSTSNKINTADKKLTFDNIETNQTVVLNEDNIETTLSDTFDSDNSDTLSIKNTRNCTIRNSTFDKIEIKDIEESPDVTTTSNTTVESAEMKQKKSKNKNSTFDKIDINDTIENNNLDTTFDKTANVPTQFNTMTDKSIGKRTRSGTINSALDNFETNNLSNLNKTFEKVADTPITSNTRVATRKKIKSKQTRVAYEDNIKSTPSDQFYGGRIANRNVVEINDKHCEPTTATLRNPNKHKDHYNNIYNSNRRKSSVINYSCDKLEKVSPNNTFVGHNNNPQINSLNKEYLQTNNSHQKKNNRLELDQLTLKCTANAKSKNLDSTFDKDLELSTTFSHVKKPKVTTIDCNKSATINFNIPESSEARAGGRKRSLTVSTAGDAGTRSKRTRFCDELQHSVQRLSRPRTQSSAAKLPNSGTPFKKFGTPLGEVKPESKMSRTKLPNFAVLHQKRFAKMESLDECQERKARRAKELLTPTGCVGLLERISPKESSEARTGGRKRSLTVSTAGDAGTRSKRTRFCDELQHSVQRLSRPRTQSSAAKLPDSGTPFKKFGTPSKMKPESKISRTKLPNFTALHQKQFARMESLDECKERKARRAKELLTPTGCVGLLEQISPKGTPPKARPPAKEPATKLHTPSKTKLYTLESLNPGYTRFGFKLNVDANPFCATSKPEVRNENHPKGSSKTIRPVLPSLAGVAGAAGRRRAAAKHAVMREKTFSERRDTKRMESRTLIKGVRTNRRFELQMKMRNINA